MKKFGLNKSDKLCSSTAIDKLFSRGADATSADEIQSVMAYPLRAVWRINRDRNDGSPVQVLISIPKKRIRHAVDRVKMRRRVREAYRLSRHDYETVIENNIDLAMIYVADSLKDYRTIEKAVCKILHKIYDEKDTEQSSVDSD